MSDSKQNEHKKLRTQQEETNATGPAQEQKSSSKDQKEQQGQARSGLNPQEDGDENICPDDKNDVEPESGSICEFQ